MNPDLSTFLRNRSPIAIETVNWGDHFEFAAAAFLGAETPPQRYLSSARAIVFHDDCILVQHDRVSRHILPSGRCEADETPEVTVRREVAEETGWSLGPLTLLGFTHFHHLTPMPPDYPYPYPDFCWPVYIAEAMDVSPERILDDGFEVGTAFLSVEQTQELTLSPIQQAYLNAALALRLG